MSAGRFIDKYFLPEIAAIIKSYMPMEITKIAKIRPKHFIVYDNMIIAFGGSNYLSIFDVYTCECIKTFGGQPFDNVSSILCNGDKIFVLVANDKHVATHNCVYKYMDYTIYRYDILTEKRDILYKNDGEIIRNVYKKETAKFTSYNSNQSFSYNSNQSLSYIPSYVNIPYDLNINFRECPVIVGKYIIIKCVMVIHGNYAHKTLLLPIDKKNINTSDEISSIRPCIHKFAISKNKKFYYAHASNGQRAIYDNITDKELYRFSFDEMIKSINSHYYAYHDIDSISEDSLFIVVSIIISSCRKNQIGTKKIIVFDIKSYEVLYLTTIEIVDDIYISPIVTTSGQLICVSNDVVKIINIYTKKEIGSHKLTSPANKTTKLSLSNDEKILIVSHEDIHVLCHIGDL